MPFLSRHKETGLNHYGIPRKKGSGGTGGRGSAQHHVADENEKHQAGPTDRTDWLPVAMNQCQVGYLSLPGWGNCRNELDLSLQSREAPEKAWPPQHNAELTQGERERERRASRPG